jgi:hypothetical protein
MTRLTTPTDTLVRIPFSGLTDFQPLALAPGLPMLDVNRLAYQVLLGWFGDLLAEPELDDEGVAFYAQRNGQRQVIVERSMATQEDLDGPLHQEFERLKKSLFDVRPVSPSERLIFNRLQPPISNYDGFLYRVLTEGGDEQLVWCWGFQRRTQYGDSRLCANPECSMLFLYDKLAEHVCPYCSQSFGVGTAEVQTGQSKFPFGKVSVAAAVVLLAGGSFWLSSQISDVSADAVSDVADVESGASDVAAAPYDDDVPEEAIATLVEDTANFDTAGSDTADLASVSESASTGVADTDARTVADAGSGAVGSAETDATPAENEPPELFVGFNGSSDVDAPASELDPDADSESDSSEVAFPTDAFPPVVSLPDFPGNLEPSAEAADPLEPQDPLPVVKADAFPQEATSDDSGLPVVLSDPVVAQTEPEETKPGSAALPRESDLGLRPESQPVTRTDVPKASVPKPDVSDSADEVVLSDPSDNSSSDAKTDDANPTAQDHPASEDPLQDVVAEPSPEKLPGTLTWHSDYLAAYFEAAQEKRYLLMLFRETIVGGDEVASTDSFFAPSMRPMLEQFSRVDLPLNAAMPDNSGPGSNETENDLPNLLLKHRSFRHLGVRSGIAVVDLTDPESANHARVVSVLPLPDNGLFSDDELMLALNLPKGAISQRTLLFAVRSTVPDSGLSMRQFSPTLIELAHRNSKYMASVEKIESFEQDARREQIAEEFGQQAELQELFFATESDATIHEAARQAVTRWTETSAAFDVLTTPATAMGMDMFQSSASGRWFVTCFVVR